MFVLVFMPTVSTEDNRCSTQSQFGWKSYETIKAKICEAFKYFHVEFSSSVKVLYLDHIIFWSVFVWLLL